jgi:tRNA pseudouridine38-40 synthase
MRILLTIEYDGTDFSGWQIQPEKRTVQGVLSDALEQVLGYPVSLHGSGRTDAGVHAKDQKAHFDLKGEFPYERLPLAINTKLPRDVSVKKAELVPDTFEAQFSAKRKTYVYDFYVSRVHIPLIDRYSTHVPFPTEKFNEENARAALEKTIGTHDFAPFSSTGSKVKDTVRTIYSAKLEKLTENRYRIVVCGNGFLYNMVRIIAGTVIEVGLSFRSPSCVNDAFVTQKRTCCGPTFAPQGLTLFSVEYEEEK